MHPVLSMGPWSLPSWIALAGLGWTAAAVLAVLLAPRAGLGRGRVLAAFAAASAAALAGSKAWVLAFEGAPLSHTPPWTSGHSEIGAILAAVAGAWLAARATRSDRARTLDVLAPAAAIGLGIGRVGCLLAGCCWGAPTLFPLALVYRDFAAPVRPIGVPLHAVPVYLAAGHLLAAAGLARALGRRAPAGRVALSFALARSAARGAVEFLRADPRGAVAGVPLPMVVLAALLVAALVARRSGSAASTPRPG